MGQEKPIGRMPDDASNPEHPKGAERLTPESFAALFQQHARVFWTLAAGVLGAPADAEDVLQEAALMALQKLDRFEPGTNFVAWMGRFVRNVSLNSARKRGRRSTYARAPESFLDLPAEAGALNGYRAPDHAGGPVDGRGRLDAGQDAFDDRTLKALSELSPVARACLLLRTVQECSYKEIATVLELPEGTAMSHVHRSRQFLRDALGPEGEAQDGSCSAEGTTPGSRSDVHGTQGAR